MKKEQKVHAHLGVVGHLGQSQAVEVAQVVVQARLAGECPGAHVARERLLARVHLEFQK